MIEDITESTFIEAAREKLKYEVSYKYLSTDLPWWVKSMELMLKVIDNYRKELPMIERGSRIEEKDIRENLERSVTHVNPDPKTRPPLSNLDSVDMGIDYSVDIQERIDAVAKLATEDALQKLDKIQQDCDRFVHAFVNENHKLVSMSDTANLFKEHVLFLLGYSGELERKNVKLAEENVLKAIRGMHEHNVAINALKEIRDDHNDERPLTGATAACHQAIAAEALKQLGED